MRTYEVLFILHPQLPEDESSALITEFRGAAEKGGAKLINQEAWGKRRLAYPIEKMTEGVYQLFVFEADGGMLNDLDRRMKNSEKVMRHMITRVDEGLKRAAKLAKRNPKKERVRPAPAGAAAPAAQAAPVAAPAPPAAAPAEAAPAAETTPDETTQA